MSGEALRDNGRATLPLRSNPWANSFKRMVQENFAAPTKPITAVFVSNIANVLYGTAKLVIPCLFRVTVV